jgi:hypothetical protein
MKFEKKREGKNLNFLKMKVLKDKMLSENVSDIIFASKNTKKYYFYQKTP